MTDYQIKNFLIVVEKMSITAAARALFISPQALHQQLNNMELELGFKLLNRNKRGITLTEAGHIFYDGISPLVSSYHRTLEAARTAASVQDNMITVLSNGFFTDIIFSAAVEQFRQENPEICLFLSIASPSLLPSADILLNDISDISEFTESHFLYRTRLYGLVKPEHPLSSHKEISWNDLFQYEVVIHSPRLLARILPKFWTELSVRSWIEYSPNSAPLFGLFQMTGNTVLLLYDIPIPPFHQHIVFPIQDTDYPVMLLTRRNIRPAVRRYIDFMAEYHRRHWKFPQPLNP